MTFHIVAVGRVRDENLRAICDDYAKRARRYTKLEIHEVAAKHQRGKSKNVVLRDEAEALLRSVPRQARAVALTRAGHRCDSRAFAQLLSDWRASGQDLAFVIGGAYGLDDSVCERCESDVSLSDMTLPHEMARVVLLEQIYRGNTLLSGEPYHKGD